MTKKTKLLLMAILVVVALTLVAFVACTPDNPNPDDPNPDKPHTHTLTKHDLVEATCQTAGTEAYWQCSGCNKYFSDADGKTEINAPVTIEKTQHSYKDWDYDDDQHWLVCEWCNEAGEKVAHTDVDLYVIVNPTKTTYYEGEELDTTGLKVALECYDECGYSVDVTKDAVIEDVELTTAVTKIEVTYGEYSTFFNIKVNELVMVEIEVTLKDGIVYYNNGLAVPKPSDFTVVAKYNDGSTKPLAENEYTVEAAQGFTTNGGKITIRPVGINNVTWDHEYTLVEVVFSELEIKTNPTNLVYGINEPISLNGLVLLAKYNDGSSQEITSGWTCNEDGESYSEEGPVTATVYYTIGDVTKQVEITFTISNNDGDVVSIRFAEGATYTIYAGEAFDAEEVELAVYAVYESGRSVALDDEKYTITVPQGTAVLGQVYKLTATLTADASKKVELPIKVAMKYDGNQCVELDGGKKNTSEKEYVVGEDGVIVETDRVVPYIGGFTSGGKLNGRAYAIWHFTSTSATTADLTFRAANSYLRSDDNGYFMEALQINTVADIYVNGVKIAIGDDVILRGTPYSEKYPPVYNIYYTFTIEGIQLGAGNNEIAIQFKESTLGQKNHWNETPSTMNIDYVEVSTYGANTPASTVQSIEVGKFSVQPEYGVTFEDAAKQLKVYGILEDGSRILLDASEYTVDITSGDKSKGYFDFGEYTVVVVLKDHEEIKSSEMNFNFESYTEFTPVSAGVKIEGDRVYWYFTFHSVGMTYSNYEFFDGSNVFAIAKTDVGPKYTTWYIDVTDWDNKQYYPHVRMDGDNYVNDSNASGDIRGTQLVYTNGQSVTLNGKKYTISTSYSMPTMVIANA